VFPTTLTPHAVLTEAKPCNTSVWRMVEAQHIASTSKLVDSVDEQDLLENLLESSKPDLPDDTAGLNFLLATPFRYPSRKGGTRFRGPRDPGVFYGAETVRTACAELGYWRHRFLLDAVDLDVIEPVFHTAFETRISTNAIDLRCQPLSEFSELWTHTDDYSHTQKLAHVAREAGVHVIIYRSVRDPEESSCLALLNPSGFAQKAPCPVTQTWVLSVNKSEVVWRRDGESRWVFTY
jgi:hypothetical protein